MSDEVSHGIVGTPSHSSDHAHSGTSSTGSASRKRKLGVPRRSLLTLNVTPKRVCVEENPGMTSHTAPVDQGSLSDAMLNSSEMPVASSAALAVDTSLAKTPLPGAHRKQARSSNLLRPLHSPHPNASPLVALAINSLSQIPIAGAIHQIGTTDDDVKTPAATAKSSISRRRRALVLQSPVVSRPDGDRTVSSSSTVQSAGLSTTNALQAEITALRREIASLEKATAHVTIDEVCRSCNPCHLPCMNGDC